MNYFLPLLQDQTNPFPSESSLADALQQPPRKSKHGEKNAQYDKYVDEIFNEYPGLRSFSSPSDYMVMNAKGDMLNVLVKNKFGLEYQNKGESDYWVGDDKLKLDNVDKHRVYINPNAVPSNEAKEAIKLDMISHAFRNNKEYLSFVDDLQRRLYQKYGKEMVDGNDGVDGYVRGYLSNLKEYEPTKRELNFLPPGYFNRLDNLIKGKSKKP